MHWTRDQRTDLESCALVFQDADGRQRAMRNEWFLVGCLDPAAFNIVLSNSAAHLDQRNGMPHGQRGLESERYHLLALQSVRKRLALPDATISDGLVGTVAGFVVHNVRALSSTRIRH